MPQSHCKRFWEGTVGVKIMPQQKRDGSYYWTFSFVRAFKRGQDAPWEYAQYYHQKDAIRLGNVMSKALQFMEHTSPEAFIKAEDAKETSGDSKEAAPATLAKAA